MENNIEEDKRNAEHFVNSIKTDKEYKEENGWHGYYNKEIVELARMLEHILSDYKRVLKENEKLKNNTRRNENELEVGIDYNWDALKKALDEAEKTNEYIIYDNEKWIKEKYCIPVQKVKDKIEDLYKEDRKWTEELLEPDSNFKNIDKNLKRIKNQIEVLKGLLESEEN